MHVNYGRIEIVFARDAREGLAGLSVYLTPFENADQQIIWLCGNRAPPVGLHALGFVGGTNPAERLLTTVDERYLPEFCR